MSPFKKASASQLRRILGIIDYFGERADSPSPDFFLHWVNNNEPPASNQSTEVTIQHWEEIMERDK
jgi:hypothetical protein